MPIESKLVDGIIYTELFGEISYDMVVKYIDFIYSMREKIDYRYELHDHTNTTNLKFGADDIRNIASYSKKTNDIFHHSFLAVYAPDDLTFGMARMFEAFYTMEKHRIHAEIFRNRGDAIQYLKKKMDERGYQRQQERG